MITTTTSSPVGKLLLVCDDHGRLCGLHTEQTQPSATDGYRRDPGPFRSVIEELDSYFAGELRDFDTELSLSGTPFQLQVWAGLRRIPYGETAGYGELAAHIGAPRAARAVGMANSRNPVGIIVPCHRVIGASGALVGYAGGLEVKRFLLDLESAHRL